MRTPPDKLIGLSFLSHPVKPPKMRWSARLVFAPGLGPDGMLDILVNDGENNPIRSGTLELAGKLTCISDGVGKLAYADFVRGKHEKGIWLHRRGVQPVPGRLAFG